MKIYKIIWHSIMIGESKVHAKNKREARMKAREKLDYDWKRFSFNTEWFIAKIEDYKESDHEEPA